MKVKLIGGLLDGETPDIEERDYLRGEVLIRVATLPRSPATVADLEAAPMAVNIQNAIYKRFVICDIEVWGAAMLRPPQVIELLVQRYAK